MTFLRQAATCLMLLCAMTAQAQKPVSVHGTYTYIISDDDELTLAQAKRRAIEMAQSDAIIREFGQMVTSEVVNTNIENDEGASNFMMENTMAMAKGDWISSTKTPEIKVAYVDGKLHFTAEVWGMAREIVQAPIDLQWEIARAGANGKKEQTTTFNNKERLFVNFKSPAAGYCAVYLLTDDDMASCLLPYRQHTSGRFPVAAGRRYCFFDKDENPEFYPNFYNLTTSRINENALVVLIYSPNPFTKCNDITGDKRHPNSLSVRDFWKWVSRCMRADKDMVFDRRFVRITAK